MNKLLPNLLLVFALTLCGLCAVQWVREGRQHHKIGGLNEDLYRKREAIQGLELTVKRNSSDINRLESNRLELLQVISSNRVEMTNMIRYSEKLERESENQQKQLTAYREAMTKANESIQKQNQDILRQNEMLKTVVKQRDDKVAELAKLAEEYNKLVTDFNKLQDAVNKAAEAAAASQAETKKSR